MKPLHERFGDLKFEKGFKYGFLIGWVLMAILAMVVLLSSPCHAQDSDTIKIYEGGTFEPGKHRAIFYKSENDTIPVTLLVRISGRPWAFFHDGWEVRKVAPVDTSLNVFEGWYDPDKKIILMASHLLYLDSRKRPIRKEWVVYQTYSR